MESATGQRAHPEQSPAMKFANLLEHACSTFEVMQQLTRKELQVVPATIIEQQGIQAVAARRNEYRARAVVPKALAESFVFNVRRANRVCTHYKDVLDIDRTERKLFLAATDPVTDVRDVHEHGADRDSDSKASVHVHGAGAALAIDETSIAVFGPEEIIMGPLNLYQVYRSVDRMRRIAGFVAVQEKEIAKKPE